MSKKPKESGMIYNQRNKIVFVLFSFCLSLLLPVLVGYRAKTKIELGEGAPIPRYFSFRPIPHLGACSQAIPVHVLQIQSSPLGRAPTIARLCALFAGPAYLFLWQDVVFLISPICLFILSLALFFFESYAVR